MATVIERLVVHGDAAPGSPLRRSFHSRQPKKTVKYNDMTANDFENRIKQQATPIAKRMEFFSKVREANMGLSTMDCLYTDGSGEYCVPKINFVLNGKGVEHPQYPKHITPGPRHSRTGSYKTTTNELHVYRGSPVISLRARSEPTPFGHYISSNAESGIESVSTPVLRAATAPRCFDKNFNKQSSRSSTSFHQPMKDSLRSQMHSSLELTGQRVPGTSQDNFFIYDVPILEDSCFPYLRSPRKGFRFPRSGAPSIPSSESANCEKLRDCLKIQKSPLPGSRKSDVPVSSSVPPGQQRKQERVDNSNPDTLRYEFLNVNSYLRFNGHSAVPKPKFSHIPRGVMSLPTPWSESVLVKLVGDLSEKKSRMPSAKYSDIAVHEDLEEYFVIGSPSSVDIQKKMIKGKSATAGETMGQGSEINFGVSERIDEEDDHMEVETIAKHTARSEISSVDVNYLTQETSLSEETQARQPIGRETTLDQIPCGDSASAPGDINDEISLYRKRLGKAKFDVSEKSGEDTAIALNGN